MSESTAAPEHLDFEAALTELERIVQALETGRLPLETALQRYQQGVALVRRCRQVLNEVAALGATDPLVLCVSKDDVRRVTLSALLPHAFGPSHLG